MNGMMHTMKDHQQTEAERLASLKELDILDSPPEAEFDGLVKAAAVVCNTPISLISLIDMDRQWFKANIGLEGTLETPREVAFCAHTITGDGIFEVSDAAVDPRFTKNPLVTGDPNIRFYAGATLRLSNGAHVGSLCVIDRQPKLLTSQQKDVLCHLSAAVVQALEARLTALKLAHSEAHFRVLSTSSPLGIYRADADGACTYTNEKWQSIYKLSSEESRGEGWYEAIHPDDRRTVTREWSKTTNSSSNFDMQFRIKQRFGDVINVRSISRPIFQADGELIGHIGSVEDVTEQLRQQSSLVKERRRLESIIEATGAGTWEWNIQTNELRVSQSWADILGLSIEDLTPCSIDIWRALVHPQDNVTIDSLLAEHFAGQHDYYDCELRMRHSEGHWIWVHVRGRVHSRSADGRPQWMFGTQMDISQRKQLDTALRQSEGLLAETGALADVGGWEIDLRSKTIQCTEQTCRVLCLPSEFEPCLEDLINCFTPESRPLLKNAISAASQEGTAWDIELPVLKPDGSCLWLRSVGHIQYSDSIAVRLVGAFQNIDDKVRQRRELEMAHERIRLATENGNIGVLDWDLSMDKLAWTPEMFALYGLTDTTSINHSRWLACLHPDDRDQTEQLLHEAIANSNGGFDMEFRIVWPDHSMHYIRASANISRDNHGTAVRMLGVNWDVTPQREVNNRLSEQRELLQATLQSIGDAVITADELSRVTWLNPAAERMTGWMADQAFGQPLNTVFNTLSQESHNAIDISVEICLARNSKNVPASKVLVSRNGQEFGIEDSAAPIRSTNGELLGIILVFHDVTEERRLSGEMRYRATHDALTGLWNRSEFETRLQAILDSGVDNTVEHALLFIDLDQFKLVNDSCGHSGGDQLLIQICNLLRNSVCEYKSTLARLGGDEFGVILEDCNRLQAQAVAQDICDRMHEFRFVHSEQRFRIGTSIGLVRIDTHWNDIEAIMQAADTCCYAAKEAGRNRVHVWLDSDTTVRVRQTDMQWATRLEQAIDEDQFQLYAQRMDSLNDKSAGLSAEVLVRLNDEDGNLIQPNSFLPAAERFNMATRIDRWILERSIKSLSEITGLCTVEYLSINLSGQSVSDCDFHKTAIQLLRNAGSDVCSKVCLEITETAAVTNIASARLFISQVRLLGVRVALDDFGAGASSFSYLKSLPVDTLKIDGQFVRGMIDDPLDKAAVRCFVDIAGVMNIKTVAECVESQAVLDVLKTLGIDYAQGYFMHKPAPINQVLQYPEPVAMC